VSLLFSSWILLHRRTPCTKRDSILLDTSKLGSRAVDTVFSPLLVASGCCDKNIPTIACKDYICYYTIMMPLVAAIRTGRDGAVVGTFVARAAPPRYPRDDVFRRQNHQLVVAAMLHHSKPLLLQQQDQRLTTTTTSTVVAALQRSTTTLFPSSCCRRRCYHHHDGAGAGGTTAGRGGSATKQIRKTSNSNKRQHQTRRRRRHAEEDSLKKSDDNDASSSSSWPTFRATTTFASSLKKLLLSMKEGFVVGGRRTNNNEFSFAQWMNRLVQNPMVRYRYGVGGENFGAHSCYYYTREQAKAVVQRLPIYAAVAFLLLAYEETAPYKLISIKGPSMLPTIAADGSDVWLRRTRNWCRFGAYQVGDIVGFAHPSFPNHVSCKRVVGVAGQRVKRYGQYARRLFVHQDPDNLGIEWPTTTTTSTAKISSSSKSDDSVNATKDTDITDNAHSQLSPYSWMDENWDNVPEYREATDATGGGQDWKDGDKTRRKDPDRTIVVPEGHVWLEGDCPGLSLDSRQFGPVPVDWLKGKLVARLWPLWKSNTDLQEGAFSIDNYRRRPHPIPLDDETLRRYNVYRINRRENEKAQEA